MVPWIVGILGVGGSFWIGRDVAMLAPQEILRALIAAQLASVVGGLLTLQAEQVRFLKTRVINSTWKTWTLLLVLYNGIILLFCPPLRELKIYAVMLPLLIMSNGVILTTVFGPIQDWIVRRRQRKARS